MKRSNRRRDYATIDRSYQYRFLVLILTYNVVIVLFLGISLFLPDILRIQDQALSLEVRVAAADRMLSMHSRVWPAVLALICLIGIHSFRTFHRFVGPLFRFRWAFDQVRNGNLAFRVRLRKKDYLKKEEEAFNEMLEALTDKLGNAQEACAEALRYVEDMADIAGKSGEARQAGWHLLRQRLQAAMQNTGYFHMDKELPTPSTEQAPRDRY